MSYLRNLCLTQSLFISFLSLPYQVTTNLAVWDTKNLSCNCSTGQKCGFLVWSLTSPKSRCWLLGFLLRSLWKIDFQVPSGCVPRGCRSEVPVSPLVPAGAAGGPWRLLSDLWTRVPNSQSQEKHVESFSLVESQIFPLPKLETVLCF